MNKIKEKQTGKSIFTEKEFHRIVKLILIKVS